MVFYVLLKRFQLWFDGVSTIHNNLNAFSILLYSTITTNIDLDSENE